MQPELPMIAAPEPSVPATPSHTNMRSARVQAPALGARGLVPDVAQDEPLRLLAYVHLRNIHRSTGAGRVARQLTEHLALRLDIDLRVLADCADRERVVPLVGAPWNEFRYHTFAAETSRQQAIWFATGRPRAEALWPEAQVVFCTGESYVPTHSARLAVTAHDAAFFEPAAHRRDCAFWTQQMKWRLLFRRLSARADMIHTVSQFSADRLLHFFPALAKRVRVVPNAVTPHFFGPVAVEGVAYLEAQGLTRGRFVLVPGGLHFRKNADLVLKGIARLLALDASLLIAIVNHSDPMYAASAEALGPRVRLLGFVEESALHALYVHAALVWFPSRYEGFGLPVLEAMAVGTPVVASDASSLPEIAGGAALLASPDDAEAHLEAIEAVLSDGRLAERMRVAGRIRAARFTWANSAAQLTGYLRELL